MIIRSLTPNRIGSDRRLPDRRPAAERAEGLRQQTEVWIGKHPTLCVSMALLLGVGLGWLVKRR